MANKFLTLMKDSSPLLSDGATGTVLFSKGLKAGACPDEWNLTYPEIVGTVAQSYASAGSDIVHTNTFGASATKLEEFGLAGKCVEINKAGVSIIRAALSSSVMISGSVGPTGKLLEPYGDLSVENMKKGFRTQLEALFSAGVDMINIETQTSLEEAIIALNTAKELNADIPVAVSMTFNSGPNGFFTIMGENIPTCINRLSDAGVDILGSNCGNGLNVMIAIAEEFRNHTSMPLLVQSNAGIPKLVNGDLQYNEPPEYFSSRIQRLIDQDISIIGGCCGTTPDHIAALQAILK